MALPTEARAGFLERACGDDAALRAQVQGLLSACERATNPAVAFLAEPASVFATPLLQALIGESSVEWSGAAQPAIHPDAAAESRALPALRSALAGRYDVERELGRGGTAAVYLARDLRHGRRVAIKVLDPVVGAALSAERFLREIRVTASLTHPHILPLYDSGEAAGLLYYVMPHLEAETLRERLARDGQLSIEEALRLLRDMVDALAYAHGRAVVHRDIKPANILLHGAHALVADFGIARAVRQARGAPDPDPTEDLSRHHAGGASETLTAAGVSPGTPAYMAPEQASGEAVDERADLYALGVVAYEMLAGSHPFGTRATGALLDAHRKEQPASLAARRPEVPPALAALVMRLLAKHPDDRPPSAEAVRHALEEIPAKLARVAPARQRILLTSLALLLTLSAGGYLLARRAATSGRRDANSTLLPNAPSLAASPHALAVLPFVNTGGDPQDEYFSDGLTDELAHALGRLPGLQLAGRTSSYAFKGKDIPTQEIGRRLGVGALVIGAVRRAGGRIRVTAQLVRATDGTVVWDSVFESHTGDVFAVQDQLTRTIVVALEPALQGPASALPRAGRGTADPEAYQLYLKGHWYFLLRGAENAYRAIEYFQRAIQRDPQFARGYAGLSGAYSLLPIYRPVPRDSIEALIDANARRAVALDSTLADAQMAMAMSVNAQLRFPEALRRFGRAIALDPSSATAHLSYGFSLMNVGQTEEAVVELNRALQLDPLVKSAASAVTLGYLCARNFPEAIAAATHALALDSVFPLAIFAVAISQEYGGQPDSAVLTLERGTRLYPEDSRLLTHLVYAYAASGKWDAAQRIREQLHRANAPLIDGTEAAWADLVFGDAEPLVRILTSPEGLRRYVMAGGVLGCNPMLDPLWPDARFRAKMRDLGVPPCRQARPWPIGSPRLASTSS